MDKILVPPSAPSLSESAKKWACHTHDQFNPTTMKRCRDANKLNISDSTKQQRLSRASEFHNELSVYNESVPGFTERTFKFSHPTDKANHPDIWLSSIKNSDHTISYWFQFPVLESHLQMAFCSLTGVPLNVENMSLAATKFPTLFGQVMDTVSNDTVSCEQVDPIFMEVAVKSLFLQGYNVKQ